MTSCKLVMLAGSAIEADLNDSTLVDYEIEHYARLATRCEYKACCAVD